MRTSVIFLFTVLLVVPIFGGQAFAADVVEHDSFDQLLKEFVDGKGQVAYARLKGDEAAMKKLDAYVDSLANAEFDGSKRSRLAAYINAYNANVIKKVVANYPTKSVMKLDNFFKREDIKVGGKKMSLDSLENKIIRPTFKEPRIHFVLVCAAKSCPKLQRKAATEGNVNGLMKSATESFIPKATTVEGKTVKTSKLFDWFKDDFKGAEGSVANYLAKYLPDHAELLKSGEATITFSDYDWALNDQ